MTRKIWAFAGAALLAFGAAAQDDACSIFAISPFGDDGHALAIYAPDGDGGYEMVSSIANANAAQVVTSHLSNEHVRAAVVLREDVPGTVVDFYTLRPSGILLDGQATLDDLLPRIGGWSYTGRYLALRAPDTSPGVATLFVYDTHSGETRFHIAVFAEYGVSWSPVQDAIAYVAADGVYAAQPDGLALWAKGTGRIGLRPLRWMSGTELAVTRCDEACVTTITDVFGGDARTVDFGEFVPEAYLASGDSYIVSRVSDGAVGLWDKVDGFRLYTGESLVMSRLTVTRDGRHLSVQVRPNVRPGVLIGDLSDSKLWYTLPLNELSETFSDAPYGDWNIREQKFLYTDAGLAWVYDATTNEVRAVIQDVDSAQWVCPSRG